MATLIDEICEELKKNLGAVRCTKLPELTKLVLVTPSDFSFSLADLADAATFKTAIQNAMLADPSVRIFLWPKFVMFTKNNEDPLYEENALGDMFVRNGKERFRGYFRKNLCLHKAAFTHQSNEGRVFRIDINNRLLGTWDEESSRLYGLSYDLLNPEALDIGDGTVATKSPVYFVLADRNEVDQRGILVDVPFINTLKRLTDVTLTQGTVGQTASSITISVKTTCDGSNVIGLLQADFIVTEANGTAIVLTDFTDNGDGTYTLESGADFVDGALVKLRAAAALTVKAYEGVNTVVVNV